MAEFDNAAVQRVAELFQTCRARHRETYPHSSLDFDRLDLTGRLTHGNWAHARGHFADVYKGNMSDGTIVAVKTLRLPTYNVYDDKIYRTALMRFFREINIWSGLSHPNVAPCLGYTLTLGNISLISLWCDKGNLAQFLRTSQDVSEPDLILDVAEGIQYLHTRSNPLVHGDLKGANILINEHGVALLADFGISKQIDDMNRNTGFTTTSGVRGTMPWMAPELKSDSSLTFPCDVYSCAGVFLEICCPGKTPFHYLRQEWDLVLAKLAGTLPDLAQYPEMTGRMALWEIMCTCWTDDPLGRPTITGLVKSLYSLFELRSRTNQTVILRPGQTSNVGQNGARTVKRLRQDSMESGSGQHVLAMVKSPAKRQKPHKSGAEPKASVRSEPIPPIRDLSPSPSAPSVGSSSRGTVGAQADGPNSRLTMSQLMAMDEKDIPAQHMKRGKGWHAVLNPQAARPLKMNLLMTLPHDSVVHCVRFSPDGKYLAVCLSAAYVYDTKTGEKICSLPHLHVDQRIFAHSVGFSPDGKLVATGASDGGVRVWELAEGKIRVMLQGHTDEVTSVAFSPTGSKLVSGSRDGTCRIWDLLTGVATVLIYTVAETLWRPDSSVVFSPDGLHVASGHHDHIVRIWDAHTGDLVEELKGHTAWVRSVSYTPDGKTLISGSDGGTVKYWSVKTSMESQSCTPPSPNGGIRSLGHDPVAPQRSGIDSRCFTGVLAPQSDVLSVATSRDGSWVVGGLGDGMVGFWDVNNPQIPQLMLKGHSGVVDSVDTGPALISKTAGGLLATGSWDGSACIWSYGFV